MNDAIKRTVVILGTGATIGSGYKRCGKKLPGDQDFFNNHVVQSLLKDGNYYALCIMLGTFREMYGENLANTSLEEVWTFLEFSGLDLYKPLTDLTDERSEWLKNIRKPESISNDEHCYCKQYRDEHTIPPPSEINLPLLAGWDLRRLLCQVYGEVASPERNLYQLLIEEYKLAKDRSTTFISLNYDTILEKELTRAGLPWHYLHVQTDVPRNESGIRILKPHGSFNWLFKGNEMPTSINADYSLTPVSHRSSTVNLFQESMIIQPTQLKQAINMSKTQFPVTTALFSNIWKSMAGALVDASRVFIVGYSFPSTDHHFRTLLHQVRHTRGRHKTTKYDEVYCCTLANAGQEELVFANANRFFPANCFHPNDRGFEDFVRKARCELINNQT